MSPTRPRSWGVWVVSCTGPVVLLGLGLVVLLQDPALWYDEAYSRIAATAPLRTLASAVWHRTGVVSYLMDVPPSYNAPYYAVLHCWVALVGDSGLALRLPTLVCAAAAAGVLGDVVRRWAGVNAGLLASLLCALGPLYLDQAVQARSYGPALFALCLCARWLQTWGRTGAGVLRSALAAGAAGLLHWFALPVVAGFAVAVLLARRRQALPPAAALAASTVPTVLLVGWSLLGGAQGAPSPPPVGLTLPVAAVRDWSLGFVPLSVALVAAAVPAWRHCGGRTALLWWFLLPTGLVTVLELWRPTYFARYLLFALLGLAAAAAVGAATLRRTRRRVAVSALLLGLSVAGTVPLLHVTDREPSPAVVSLLADQQAPGEPIVPADGRATVDLETSLHLAPRLAQDIVRPPTLFTDRTTSDVVWLVRVVLQQNSVPLVPAEQRLTDAGWTEVASTVLVGATTNLRVERWTRASSG